MSAESPRHARSGGPLTVPSQPPTDRGIIDAVSGFINDVKLTSSSSAPDFKDTIQWARFETADINEPVPECDSGDLSPLLLILGYGSGVQVWLIPPNGEAQEVLSWRQGTVRVLRILPTPQNNDAFVAKRPLLALCDSASPGPTFCSLSFLSIRGGEQVKSIKFKNPILDVLANKRSVVVSFAERFAVFDAGTLEDRMAITTCYPCPCPLGSSSPINPLALGDKWLAYADKKINPSKRSSGGCEGEGVPSYTATVLHAAKSLSKGLRGLGESVAQSLAGARGASPPRLDQHQPGVVTVIDVEGCNEEENQDTPETYNPIIAHFIAHSEAIIALKFDPSGMLLVTADKRGHDFHVFRINPHPCGPNMASVHHLYILHRGDTTAKVQDIEISLDSRWAAISTLRGTTHIFPMSPYGGVCAARTHCQPRVVNRLSRFHRSAGLPIQTAATARSASPIDPSSPRLSEISLPSESLSSTGWFPSPLSPPHPRPTLNIALATNRPHHHGPTNTITRNSSGRQRLSSLSEDSQSPLLARCRFGCSVGVASAKGGSTQLSLYVITADGVLLHLALLPRVAKSVPKEKVCDESPIEMDVEALAQWRLARPINGADLLVPLPSASPLLHAGSCRQSAVVGLSSEERWLSQVEIVTHAGPHRRLWMGPQFLFKTYNCTGSNSSLSEAEAVEVDASVASGIARSNPVNMPGVRPIVPVLIDSGSASSLEHSPSDSFRRKSLLAESGRAVSVCDVQLREDLAEAMKEDQGWSGGQRATSFKSSAVERAVDPQGTVVPTTAIHEPIAVAEHALNNADEAQFRPVLPAIAPLPEQSFHTHALPGDTRIPVQSVAHMATQQMDESHPLATHVLIPAALTPHHYYPPLQHYHSEAIAIASDSGHESLARSEHSLTSATDSSNHSSDNNDNINIHESVLVYKERANKSDCIRKKSVDDDSVSVKSVASVDVKNDETVCNKPVLQSTRIKNVESKEREVGKERKKNKSKKSKENREQYNIDNSCETPNVPEIQSNIDVHELNVEAPKIDEEVPKINEKALKANKEVPEINVEAPKVNIEVPKAVSKVGVEIEYNNKNNEVDGRPSGIVDVIPPTNFTIPLPSKSKNIEITKLSDLSEIKTEEQAWDMLINDSMNIQPNTAQTLVEEPKPKSKRSRKNKKSSEESLSKADNDSFVEIHNIVDKNSVSVGDLVAISNPFDNSDTPYPRARKRSTKSATPERALKGFDYKVGRSCEIILNDNIPDTEPELDFHEIKQVASISDISNYEHFDAPQTELLHIDGTASENISMIVEKPSKSKKSKSLSPYLDGNRKIRSNVSSEKKDYIVIDSSKDEYPDIQITTPKSRNPQTRKMEDVVLAPPMKSWSSIAAKSSKKSSSEEIEIIEAKPVENVIDEQPKKPSVEDKLFELYNRTNIMVAECDTPSEISYSESFPSFELPPLEPLEFSLDTFKLDMMTDSILEVEKPSPICKINLSDILSSIKENKTESFSVVDVKKAGKSKEAKGYCVVEENIVTQEVDINVEGAQEFEKSSDDDNTSPVLSADSDKEKSTETPISSQSKQPSKSKKSRRKKK